MRHLLAAVAEPVFADGNELFVTASMGAAVCGFGATEPDTLLRNAEIAMYRAKEQGRNSFCFYTPGLESGVPQRVRIEAQLRHALEREEFSLCYQPVVDSASRRIVGAEALLRWHHPELGPVSPREFVPVLEETKLIIPVGTWVLEQACRAAVEMDSDNERGLQMAVNVSREQVREPGFVRAVEQALTNSGLSPARLVVEITESLLMEQSAPVIERLEALERRGVGIAVDDFGTGYSSLSYLKRFPVTSLKIDRSFVGGVPGDQDDRAIVVAIMAMARSLGLSVVAEGVETAEQARFLEQWPGSRAQGYYFGAPMEAEALSDRLRELEPTGSD
jgi:EAL domain-containing protein (putative c-di-GMP-specific phosphodiesterase class I)